MSISSAATMSALAASAAVVKLFLGEKEVPQGIWNHGGSRLLPSVSPGPHEKQGVGGEVMHALQHGNGPVTDSGRIQQPPTQTRPFESFGEASPVKSRLKLAYTATATRLLIAGVLAIVRNHEKWARPYTGLVPIVTGEVCPNSALTKCLFWTAYALILQAQANACKVRLLLPLNHTYDLACGSPVHRPWHQVNVSGAMIIHSFFLRSDLTNLA